MKYYIFSEGEFLRVTKKCFVIFVLSKSDEEKAVFNEIRYYRKGNLIGYVQLYSEV